MFPHMGGSTFSKQDGHQPRSVTPQCPAPRSAGALWPEVRCSGHSSRQLEEHLRAVQQLEHSDPAQAVSTLQLPPTLPTLKALSHGLHRLLHSLVAVLFEVLLVAVIMQDDLRVAGGEPVRVLDLGKQHLVLRLLPLPASGHRC